MMALKLSRPSLGGGIALRRHASSPEAADMQHARELQRPGTALGAGAASELKALRQSKSFAAGEGGVLGLSGRTREDLVGLPTVPEGA